MTSVSRNIAGGFRTALHCEQGALGGEGAITAMALALAARASRSSRSFSSAQFFSAARSRSSMRPAPAAKARDLQSAASTHVWTSGFVGSGGGRPSPASGLRTQGFCSFINLQRVDPKEAAGV